MINRELIRSKVVQTCYAYAQNPSKSAGVVEQELALSLSKSHEMYFMLLMLLTEVSKVAERMYDVRVKRAERLGETIDFSPKFVRNQLMHLLQDNRELQSRNETMSEDLRETIAEYARTLWTRIEQAAYFQAYMQSTKSSFEEDLAICRELYRNEICNNEELDEIFEDMGLYWNDDKAIVDTFVLKTLGRFTPDSTPEQPLLPEFRKDEDREYAMNLLRYALEGTKQFDELIAQNSSSSWDLERIALMDRVIIRIALAEIISFPSIPIEVSINEYVELSKVFSTPNSSRFVNGALDNIVRKLQDQKKLLKQHKHPRAKAQTSQPE